METMSLQSITRAVNGICDTDCSIENICIDTRKLKPNCLYIAIVGENFDGHDFIDQAFSLGARAVISAKEVSHENVVMVKDTKRALLDLARHYKSLFNVFSVGITGSVGKTSTKEMIYTILNAKGKTMKTKGNFNNEIGLPMSMFELSNEYRNAVFEMGMSDFGEIRDLTTVCRPNVGVITNIGVSHIETLKTRENILKAKLEIIEGMEYDAPLVLNADDDLLSTVCNHIDNPIIYFGIENSSADIVASNIVQEGLTTYFDISFFGKSISAQIPTIGKHNIKNALAGFCVGIIADVPPDQIVGAMKWYRNVNMRQNTSIENGITIIEDCYNASPDSMAAAIDVVISTKCSGKRICVFGDMLELGEISEQAHVDVGKLAARSHVDMLLCYGEKARDIKRGAIIVGMKNVLHFDDKKRLAEHIASVIQSGDVIVYKASRGIKMEEVVSAVRTIRSIRTT